MSRGGWLPMWQHKHWCNGGAPGFIGVQGPYPSWLTATPPDNNVVNWGDSWGHMTLRFVEGTAFSGPSTIIDSGFYNGDYLFFPVAEASKIVTVDGVDVSIGVIIAYSGLIDYAKVTIGTPASDTAGFRVQDENGIWSFIHDYKDSDWSINSQHIPYKGQPRPASVFVKMDIDRSKTIPDTFTMASYAKALNAAFAEDGGWYSAVFRSGAYPRNNPITYGEFSLLQNEKLKEWAAHYAYMYEGGSIPTETNRMLEYYKIIADAATQFAGNTYAMPALGVGYSTLQLTTVYQYLVESSGSQYTSFFCAPNWDFWGGNEAWHLWSVPSHYIFLQSQLNPWGFNFDSPVKTPSQSTQYNALFAGFALDWGYDYDRVTKEHIL